VTDSHLDNTVLASLQDIMEDEYPLLLQTFLNDSEERLELLRNAVRDRDAETLRLVAHSFKGSCSNMGATELAALCKELEDMAREDTLVSAREVLERVEREFAIVRILLRVERQRFQSRA
jgi:HPt (histidine-containing phosphotransfer) domain-containing protein